MGIDVHYNDLYKLDEVQYNKFIECKGWPTNRFEFAVLYADKSYTVCDIGCGNGKILYSLQKKYNNFIGYEISEGRTKIACLQCKDMNVSIINKKFDVNFNIEKNFVDTVICLDVLDHMLDVRQAICNIFNMLKDGGKLIITVPNFARIDKRIALFFGYFPSTATSNEGVDRHLGSALFDGGKLHYFTFRSLSLLLTEVGFKNIDKYGIGKYKKLHNIYPEILSGSIALVCIK